MDRFSIADVAHLPGLLELKNNSSNPETYCVCPFCGNRKGKFSYIVKKGDKENMYHCWSCGESGSAVELYMKLSGLDNLLSLEERIERAKKKGH